VCVCLGGEVETARQTLCACICVCACVSVCCVLKSLVCVRVASRVCCVSLVLFTTRSKVLRTQEFGVCACC
jgi:hypothetical protein